MSKTSTNKSPSPSSSQVIRNEDEDYSTKPEFIYGGPFIKLEKIEFINTTNPFNIPLQGTFKKSFAYYSLKERLPIILTKVIDYLSRESAKIKSSNSASDEDVRGYIQYVTKLKNDLVTNKKYDDLTVDTPDAKRWNQWIFNTDSPYYFSNVWLFTECYVYRRLREGCELSKGLQKFDPFDEQKSKAFANSLEPMCVVADKLVSMLPQSDKDKRKADFITLLKISLWANKCDLSLSMGEEVRLKAEGVTTSPSRTVIDPVQMVLDLKDKLLVDDSAKICDVVCTRAENIGKAIDGPEESKPAEAAPAAEGEEPQLPPCPAKLTVATAVMFDIICDNAGYELFADLCLAHFLVAQNIVKKVRFHVKSIPWFVSDVTPQDFKNVISECSRASYNRTVPPEPQPAPAEGEPPPAEGEPRIINSDTLKQLGDAWARYSEDGTFVVMADWFWTSPHPYKDMKRYDPLLYRKLQFAAALLFKGDLNYRKLLADRCCIPTLGFEPALQGFIPAPVIALRTVKAELICGLPKGKWEQLNKINEKWMQTGDYGVIQLCAKAEPLKVSDRPCADYGDTCFGEVCPPQID